MRVAPNGDIFVAESDAGKIRVLRAADGADKPASDETFAEGLERPFGIAFYPLGPNPQWVYVANTNSVVRFPYRNGDLKARGPAETIVVPTLAVTGGGHWTRDVAFSLDGTTHVRLGRLRLERRRGDGQEDPGRDQGLGRRAMPSARPGARRRTAPTCWRSTRPAKVSTSSPPASATASTWRSSPTPARSGAPPTSATCWATTCRRTT